MDGGNSHSVAPGDMFSGGLCSAGLLLELAAVGLDDHRGFFQICGSNTKFSM